MITTFFLSFSLSLFFHLQNGRVAMFGFAVYVWEEFITQTPLIDIPGNELLFKPAYQVPYIQKWLDNQFSGAMGDLWT